MQKRAKWIVIALVLVFSALPLFLLFWLMDDDDFAAVDRGQSYGSSIYKNYQDGVYAAVPSNGYYRVAEADPASFEAFDTGAYDGRQAARDRRNVYCGNRILPDMKPASARYLGNSYFTDGAVTRKLIREGKLAVPQSETVLEAKTRYRRVFSIF